MVVINKKKGETKDSMFKKFTKTYLEEEIIDEVRDRMHYKKPSQVNKEKEKERKTKRRTGGKTLFGRRGGRTTGGRPTRPGSR